MAAGDRSELDFTAWSGRIFVFWLGPVPMSRARQDCLSSFSATGCEVHLITDDTLGSFIEDGSPLHPAYEYLSAVHKSDYLRAYFMHRYGGGYSDIKRSRDSWQPCLSRLEASDCLGAGYAENFRGVAKVKRPGPDGRYYYLSRRSNRFESHLAYWKLKIFHRKLIGNGAFAFKPQTDFTRDWLHNVEKRLDLLLPLLGKNPAKHPYDRPGMMIDDGRSLYPVPWSFLLGDILAPLSYRYRKRLLRCLPEPDFTNYR